MGGYTAQTKWADFQVMPAAPPPFLLNMYFDQELCPLLSPEKSRGTPITMDRSYPHPAKVNLITHGTATIGSDAKCLYLTTRASAKQT